MFDFMENLHWYGTVSYTHLDVYKRQTAERVKGMVEIRDTVRELIAMQMEESVTDEEIHKRCV